MPTRNQISRHNWTTTLDAVQATLAEQVDGRRTIREIIAAVEKGLKQDRTLADLEQFAKTLFQSLWRLDFVAMGLRPNA